MKTTINFSQRDGQVWYKASVALFTCLLLLTFSSCQKDEDNILNKEIIKGQNLTLNPELTGNSSILLYGPVSYTRVTGEPFEETQILQNPNFEYFDSIFILKIKNGRDKNTRISSAEIKIDCVLVAGPSDFSKNTALITKQLSGLKSGSILEVKLNSAPGSFIELSIEGTLKDGTIADIDGNLYKTVKIGDQQWMAENLKTTKYNDDTDIPLVTDQTAWKNLSTPGYCWYNNDATTFKNTYGALYNWYTANTGKLCPAGWHVPTDVEFTTLSNFLINNGFGFEGSGTDIAKSLSATTGWTTFTTPGTIGNDQTSNNSSGFSALPGGLRNLAGMFYSIGMVGCWWSSTPANATNSWIRILNFNFTEFGRVATFRKIQGSSIRCLKDQGVQ
jgi:uncharacterized protein (TIGR02145 family)